MDATNDSEYAPAPPAIVPNKNLLISMTFLTVPEAKVDSSQLPIQANNWMTYRCSYQQ